MTKKIAAICLCMLMLCAQGVGLADALLTGTSDAQILSAVFPGRTFTPDDEDFCYSDEEARYYVREARQFGNSVLIVIERLGKAHVVGWQNFVFAVCSLETGTLIGKPLDFGGDEADYLVTYQDGKVSVLYVSSTSGQGWENGYGSKWTWDGAAWQQVWPSAAYGTEAYSTYWENQKGEIDHGEQRGSVEMYTRVITNRDTGFIGPEFTWEFSHNEYPGYPPL